MSAIITHMNSDSKQSETAKLLALLDNVEIDDAEEFVADLKVFLATVEESASCIVEEPVPAEMMEMFTDEQWPALLFELQPGARLIASQFDVAATHRHWLEHGELGIGEQQEMLHWIVYSDDEGQLIRQLDDREFTGLRMALEGKSFETMACGLWPELASPGAHHKMTEMVIGWLNDQLIIDAGVPLPEDAEFELPDEDQLNIAVGNGGKS